MLIKYGGDMKAKAIIFTILCIFCFLNTNGQNYDLIVKHNGDSLGCYIDSVAEKELYIRLKFKGAWIKTHLEKEFIKSYEFNCLEKEAYYFDPINSIIYKRKFLPGYQHGHMYMFGPSPYSLNEGQFYYSTYYLLIHDVQYAFTDNFTVRFGTDIIFFPFYFIPSYSFKISQKSNLAIGDLLLVMPGEGFGNLIYGMYSYGNEENHFSIGLGYFGVGSIEDMPFHGSPAISFSYCKKLNDRVYLTGENYAFKLYQGHVAYNTYTDIEVMYHTYDPVFLGMGGLKIAGKKNNLNSWQFGLLYVIKFNAKAPDEYQVRPWENSQNESFFVPVPMLCYYRKFGKKIK